MKRYVVWLTINRQCNLHCYWCYQEQLIDSRERMLLSTAKELIDLSIGIGALKIIILGGEPTIHPDFLGIVKHSSAVETAVLTNSIAFANKGFCKRAEDAGLDLVSTSLKGASEEDYIKGCGGKRVFQKVMRAIENIEASSMRHQVSITVSRSVIDHWDAMLILVRQCKAENFTFSFERPVVVKEEVFFDDGMLPGNVARFIEERMYPSLKETGVNFDLNITFPQCHFSENFVEKGCAEGHMVAGCQLLMDNGVVFDPSGHVLICNHMVDHPLGTYGKDFRTPDEMIEWRSSPQVRRFYELAGAPPGAQCGDCPKWGRCGAGCRIFWLYKGANALLPVKPICNQ